MLGIGADGKADAAQNQYGEGPVDSQNGSGITAAAVGELNQGIQNGGAEARGLGDIGKIAHADVAPPAPDQAKEEKDDELYRQHYAKRIDEQLPLRPLRSKIEAQPEAQGIGNHEQPGLRQQN